MTNIFSNYDTQPIHLHITKPKLKLKIKSLKLAKLIGIFL